ncbi:MAG: CHAT domain-containing protein [Okeania sp. SIO2H7]|nr:CHAT domain-containing protein [Okeania sp. SIO2H7]
MPAKTWEKQPPNRQFTTPKRGIGGTVPESLTVKEKFVIIIPGYGSLKQGFPCITALLFNSDRQLLNVATGHLPPTVEIDEKFLEIQIKRRSILRRQLTNFSHQEINQRVDEFSKQFKDWLNSASFLPIQKTIYQNFDRNDSIQIIFQTKDIEVQRLPWHLWSILDDYPNAEISYGLSNKKIGKYSHPKSTLKILSILGNSDGIDVEIDRQILGNLPGAEVKFLIQPTRRELTEELWRDRGWDVLTFSGHSTTKGGDGLIFINDKDRPSISQLKYAFKQAIANGLQMGVFNSCKGLGLAAQLGYFNLPQAVVMREPVPDRVAQEFIKHFFHALIKDNSLHKSVRQAREKLQGLEDELPCASWLPVMFQGF